MYIHIYLIKKNRLRLRRVRVAAGAFALRHLRARENSAIYCTGATERSKVPLRPRSEPTVRSNAQKCSTSLPRGPQGTQKSCSGLLRGQLIARTCPSGLPRGQSGRKYYFGMPQRHQSIQNS